MSGRARKGQNPVTLVDGQGQRRPAPGTEDPFAKAKEQEEARIAAVQRRADQLQQQYEGLKVTVETLRTALDAAREESANLRAASITPADAEDAMPKSVTLVSIDNISRAGDKATLACCVDIDGMIGDTTVVLSVESLRLLLKSKTRKTE